MSTTEIDYDALAAKYGGTSSPAPQAGAKPIDYDALAAKYGGTSTDAPTVKPTPAPSTGVTRQITSSHREAPIVVPAAELATLSSHQPEVNHESGNASLPAAVARLGWKPPVNSVTGRTMPQPRLTEDAPQVNEISQTPAEREGGFRHTIANSAIGHSVQQTMPKVSEALGLTPTDTVYNPDYEAHKEQLVSLENLIPVTDHSASGNLMRGALKGASGLTSGPSMATLAAVAATGGLAGPAIPVFGKLVSAGFAAQTAVDLIKQAPELAARLASGKDPEGTYEQLGRMGFDAAMLKGMVEHVAGRPMSAANLTSPRAWRQYGEERQAAIQTPQTPPADVAAEVSPDKPVTVAPDTRLAVPRPLRIGSREQRIAAPAVVPQVIPPAPEMSLAEQRFAEEPAQYATREAAPERTGSRTAPARAQEPAVSPVVPEVAESAAPQTVEPNAPAVDPQIRLASREERIATSADEPSPVASREVEPHRVGSRVTPEMTNEADEVKARFGDNVPEKYQGFDGRERYHREQVYAQLNSLVENGRISPKEAETRFAALTSPEERTASRQFEERIGSRVPAQRVAEGDTPVQNTSAPEPGHTGEVSSYRDLTVDPHRFQYKLDTDADGVTQGLKDARTFNPLFANVLSVWRDPADGKMYVINGHHRYELARRADYQGPIAVSHIVAQNAEEARAIGALQNIADGKGTPVDAAKFFRDTSLTLDDLRGLGVSMGEATAAKGVALSNLAPEIFNAVVQKDLPVERAVAIGEATKDHAEQKAILDLVNAKEKQGRRVTNDTLRELVRFVKGSGQTTETTASLFGDQEVTRSLALEKAEISAYVKEQLRREKTLFGFVARGDRASKLADANVGTIDVEKSKGLAVSATQGEEIYNRLSGYKGPVSTVLDAAAERLANGENPVTVKQAAYRDIRAEVSRAVPGSEAESVARGKEVAGHGNAGTGAEEPSDLKGPPEGAGDLFRPKATQPGGLSDGENAPTFFLKSQRTIEEKMANRASSASVRQLLVNSGVKADEMKWTGLDDLLASNENVTKQQVLDHLAQNDVQIKEVTHGSDPNELRRIAEEREKLHQQFERGEISDEAGNRKLDELRDREDAQNTGTKFESYTLPGGENYREMLMTLPKATTLSDTRPSPEVTAKYKDEWDALVAEKHRLFDEKSEILRNGSADERPRFNEITSNYTDVLNQMDALHGKMVQETISAQPQSKLRGNFQSAHFDEPNILAHVRMDDRTDADGKRVLMVEEVQSDWHQKGRKEGYTDGTFGVYDSRGPDTNPLAEFKTQEEAHQWALQQAKDRTIGPNRFIEVKPIGAVPDAPFKNTWHELAMKRVMRYAAENGYDRVAWTPGEVQNARYDLSKQISKVEWYPSAGDANTGSLTAYDHGGNPVMNEKIPSSKVEDYVGKDVAKRLLDSETIPSETGRRDKKQLEGLDLQVGGSGMKGFYDKMLPDFMNKYGKKWGAKVGETQLSQSGDGLTRIPVTVHSIDVTPAMRQSVMQEGQPLFRGGDTGGSASNISDAKADVFAAKGASPARVELNPAAMDALHQAYELPAGSFSGITVTVERARAIEAKLREIADKQNDPKAEKAIGWLANAMRSAANKAKGSQGVIIIGKGDTLAHVEETLHAGQRAAGSGDINAGVPFEKMAEHPVFQKMSERIKSEVPQGRYTPFVGVAEGSVDLFMGEAKEISKEDARSGLGDYLEAVHATLGTEAVKTYSEHLAEAERIYREASMAVPEELSHARVVAKEITSGTVRGASSEHGSIQSGDAAGRPEDGGRVSGETQSNEGGGLPEPDDLHRPLGQGVDRSGLDSWLKGAQSLTVESAGEQVGLFGDAEPMHRIVRTDAEGNVERHLVTEKQLAQLQKQPAFRRAAAQDKQQGLFGSDQDGELVGNGNRDSGMSLPPQKSASQDTLFRPRVGFRTTASRVERIGTRTR